MSTPEFIHKTVENFLAQHRCNLIEDREELTTLLKDILHEQQTLSRIERVDEEETNFPNGVDLIEKNHLGENKILSQVKKEEDANDRKSMSNPKLCLSDNHSKFEDYNSQIEKERLANLFGSAPYAFDLRTCAVSDETRKGSPSCRHRRNSKQFLRSRNKENVTVDSEANITNNASKLTVRYGEFSPLNPAFRSNKTSLGLGEYGELRKVFLEKKRQEYMQYWKNINWKQAVSKTKDNSRSSTLGSCSNQIDKLSLRTVQSASSKFSTTFRENTIMSDFRKRQQEAYRRELDTQVEEKKKLQQAEEENEKKWNEFWNHQEMVQREDLMKSIEEKFCRRIHCNGVDGEEEKFDTSTASKDHSNTGEKNVECQSRVARISGICSPILNSSMETCAVDNYEAYQKMQQEQYKKDLAEQIMEKRKLEKERTEKEMEMDRKLEENARKAEEKLKLQYEKEQAERNYRATQKALVEKQLQENLCKIQKQNEEKKKSAKVSLQKTCTIYPTHHKPSEKPRNVKFSTHAFMYPVSHGNLSEGRYGYPELNRTDEACKSGSVIVHAPYILAVKDNEDSRSFSESNLKENLRSPSPVLPAVKTRNLINALPKREQFEIPPGVSMSEKTKCQFMKDEKILSNLSEIRRKLLENETKGCQKK